jgi:hypothetical protein
MSAPINHLPLPKKDLEMGYVPAPRAPAYAVRQPRSLIRGFIDPVVDSVKARLLKDDPDWPEFCRRWAEEFGEP